ncbi:MAG: hypothetical protein R3E89_01565 [Thiolinea sp.]
MGNQFSVEASGLSCQYPPRFLLVEGETPIRLDIFTVLRRRFPGAQTEHVSAQRWPDLAQIAWSHYDLVIISCPRSICEPLSWMNAIKHSSQNVTCHTVPLVIVMTGSEEGGRAALQEGADIYMLHDVSTTEFAARLDVLLEVERLAREYPLILPEWRWLEVLHDSENAVIALAENHAGERAVIKRFKLDASRLPAAAIDSFLADIEVLRQQRDRRLVSMLDAGVRQGVIYIIMEYIQGIP